MHALNKKYGKASAAVFPVKLNVQWKAGAYKSEHLKLHFSKFQFLGLGNFSSCLFQQLYNSLALDLLEIFAIELGSFSTWHLGSY